MKVYTNKGRNQSHVSSLNYLSRQGNIFIMDNHLAAFWCWAKVLDPLQNYSLLHIDRHHDLSTAHVQHGFQQFKKINFRNITIQKALELKVNSFQMLQWDNSLPLYQAFFPLVINSAEFVSDQDLPTAYSHCNITPIKKWIKETEDDWKKYIVTEYMPDIINLDIDVFFKNDSYKEVLSENFLQRFIAIIHPLISNAKIVTIALSPECCGGWDKSLAMCEKVTRLLNIKFDSKLIT
ncbi:MAG: peptide arginase family protein [Neobacillus sp.]